MRIYPKANRILLVNLYFRA